jgi:hypothetical protein
MNPFRIFAAVATLGASEAIIGGAEIVSKVVPLPTTCCGCPTIYHEKISGNIYHCRNCKGHCGHIGIIARGYCYICGKEV